MQGLVLSLPYCYFNTEVQNVARSHYNRWQLIRSVGGDTGKAETPNIRSGREWWQHRFRSAATPGHGC